MKPNLRIGIDFDNTIASYDELIHRVALERNLIDAGEAPNKRTVRDRIRQRENGEVEWQMLQGIVYGPRMGEALPIHGVREFFNRCRKSGAQTFIVSHKTEYANFDPTQTPLRKAALAWMETKGFFLADGLDLSRADVYFEATRQEKIGRIQQLGCTHFVDDLEEVFREDGFPEPTMKVLFAPQPPPSPLAGLAVASTWDEVARLVFDART
ncbi:MAG: hypothetical protein HYZ52_02820 [Candidatus Omnitrophica bacterium]|nr:hypothetical protein [Candidatus Omnitrophota bacterium]